MAAPEISVLMIVHNRAAVVGAAVRSVLAQSHADLELIVVDDGSTDETVQVVEKFDDPRLRLIVQECNQGIPISRNLALDHAQGRYMAWLDSDDVCHPDRLRIQRDFLLANCHIDMIGSAARKIDDKGRLLIGGRVTARSHDEIRTILMFRSAFQQSSIFGRAEAMAEIRYDPDFPVCEDVDMFARFTDRFRVANLPLFLIARRIHAGQTIRSNVDLILERQMRISSRALEALGLSFDAQDLQRHVILGGSFDRRLTDEILDWAERWVERLKEANHKTMTFDPVSLAHALDRLLVKAATRRFRPSPSGIASLAQRAARRPAGAARLIGENILPLLPALARPSAAGIRQVLSQ